MEANPKMTEERKQDNLSQNADASTEEDEKLTSTERPISLLERKRLQWLQERGRFKNKFPCLENCAV